MTDVIGFPPLPKAHANATDVWESAFKKRPSERYVRRGPDCASNADLEGPLRLRTIEDNGVEHTACYSADLYVLPESEAPGDLFHFGARRLVGPSGALMAC